MAETDRIVDGKLEITKTQESVISTYSRDEIVGKIAEIQTRINHRDLDNATDEAEKAKWESYLTSIDK
jgi:hypothetical protein